MNRIRWTFWGRILLDWPIKVVEYTGGFRCAARQIHQGDFRETLLTNPVFHKELDKVLVQRLRSSLHDQLETTFEQRQYFVQPENTDQYPFFETGDSIAELEYLTPRTLKNVQARIREVAEDQ